MPLAFPLSLLLPCRRAFAALCTAMLWFLLLPGGGLALAAPADGDSVERAVKAASIYRFLGYVEWPPAALPAADAGLVIGVVNADELADELARVTSGRTVDGRKLQVRKLRPGDSIAGLHALFVGRSPSDAQAQMLRAALAKPILTITDAEGALALGSIINFRLVDGRVRFEVSLGSAEKSGLKISSRMLQVALSVRMEAPQ